MLTGNRATMHETVENVLHGQFTFPEEVFKGVSEQVKDLIAQMLRKDPAKRPSASIPVFYDFTLILIRGMPSARVASCSSRA